MRTLFVFGILVPFLAFGQVSSQEDAREAVKIDGLFVIDGSPTSFLEDPQERQLFYAIREGEVSRVRSLIEDEGLDVNLRYTSSGNLFRNWTPLMFAAHHTDISMVRYLVNDLGADPCLEVEDFFGTKTALDIISNIRRYRDFVDSFDGQYQTPPAVTRQIDEVVEFLSTQEC